MRVILTCFLAYLGLALASNYKIRIRNDGSTLQGGTVRFSAEVLENGKPAVGHFQYEWKDNTVAQHYATHDSSSNKDEWLVPYTEKDGTTPGSYVATVTVRKLMNFAYALVGSKESSFSVTRHMHGPFLVDSKASDTDYMVKHRVKLTNPNAKYLEDNNAVITTYWYVDGTFYAAIDGLTFTMKYPKLYRRIGVQALVVVQLHGKKKQKNSNKDTVYNYVDNLLNHPVIYHYSTCDASFPYVNTELNIQVNKNTILGCFTRGFRLWDSVMPGAPWRQPFVTSGSLEGINYARENILSSQNRELGRIANPFVKTIVSNRIDAINHRIPIVNYQTPIDYSTLNARMQRMKESEDMALDRIKDPYVKSVVEENINEPSKTASLSEIHERLNDMKKAQEVTDPIARAALLNKMNEENKSLKTQPITDSVVPKEVKEKKEAIDVTEKPKDKKIKTAKPPKSSDVVKSTVSDVSQRIEDLKTAENMVLDSITDPAIKDLVIDKIHEQNKRIPLMLKSSGPDAGMPDVLDAIQSRINKEIQRTSDISLDGVVDPFVKQTIMNKIGERRQILMDKSKEIDENLRVPLSEIRERIKALKDAEDSAVESVSDPDVKEEVISTIDKENEKIPVLMLPLALGKNFSFVLDMIRAKMGDLTTNEASLTRNVTDPIVQAMIASKFDKVNYILNSKFKMLSDGFANVLNVFTASVDDASAEERKTPVLSKSFDVNLDPEVPEDMDFPSSLAANFSVALDAINDKINSLKDTTNVVTKNITIPAIQALVASKLDYVSNILSTKYKELSDNFTNIVDTISSKLSGVTLLDGKKTPKLGKSLDGPTENVVNTDELITNFTIALDTLRTRMDDLQGTQDNITQNITNPFVQTFVASRLNTVNWILNTKYKQLSDNFTSFLNTIVTKPSKKIPKLSLAPGTDLDNVAIPASLVGNFSVALDSFSTRIDDLKDTTSVITQNITNPAVQALVASKLDKVSTILNTKFKELSDNLTAVMDTISAKLSDPTLDKKSKKPGKVPKLGISLESEPVPEPEDTVDPDEMIANFTTALDTLRTKIDDLEVAQDNITMSMINPFAQTIVSNKLNMVNWILNTRYKQLSDNFTNFLNSLPPGSVKKTPKLTLSPESSSDDNDDDDLSLPASLAANFTTALESINTRILDLQNTTNLITQNITDPAVQAMVSSKLDKVNTILSTKYKELSDNFTGIIDIINEKLTNTTIDATSSKSSKKPKKVPKLGKSVDDTNSDPEVIANFTIALDAIRTRIDDLKNVGDVITQNITNPFAQTIVASKMDRINFILKTKFKQLNDNFTTIMDTINAKLIAAADESDTELTGAKKVPKLQLTSAFDFTTNFSIIMDTVRARIMGKQKPVDATTKFIKDPAIREVVMNKIIEENKNLSTIADSVEANLTAALDDFIQKAKDLNTLEDLTVDYIDDPVLQDEIVKQIDEENNAIPFLSLSKHDMGIDTTEPVQYSPPKILLFKLRLATSGYHVKLTSDGPTVRDGTVHFFAQTVDGIGNFRYSWQDNSTLNHKEIHETESSTDTWTVTYPKNSFFPPGPYQVQVTVEHYFHSLLIHRTSQRLIFELTDNLNGKLELVQSNKVVTEEFVSTSTAVTHKVVLSKSDEDYLNRTATSVLTYWFVNCMYYGFSTDKTFAFKYAEVDKKYTVEALVIASFEPTLPTTTPTTEKKTKRSRIDPFHFVFSLSCIGNGAVPSKAPHTNKAYGLFTKEFITKAPVANITDTDH